jgi:hypothetical protein
MERFVGFFLLTIQATIPQIATKTTQAKRAISRPFCHAGGAIVGAVVGVDNFMAMGGGVAMKVGAIVARQTSHFFSAGSPNSAIAFLTYLPHGSGQPQPVQLANGSPGW